MKLIVTIPAFNEEKTIASVIQEIPRQISGIDKVEVLVLDDGSKDRTKEVAKKAGADYVISHKENKGLALTFKDALEAALKRGADIIVNTDADNHYNQSRIPELIKPILDKKADMVIGDRQVKDLEFMPKVNKYGNILGSYSLYKLANLPEILDASSGFRAYTREAALKINVLSKHTYCHETLIQALDQDITITQVPIKARPVKRKSRLISSIPKHITKSLIVILRTFTLYKPLRVMSILGGIIFAIGLAGIIRFLYFYFTAGGSGHIQSLIISAILIIVGFQIGIMGLIASAIGWNRKILEEVLYRIKKEELKK